MHFVLIGLLLTGLVSNELGRIGVVVSQHGRVYRVHSTSPAHDAGIEEGDVILSSDGTVGTKCIDGMSHTVAHLYVLKKSSGQIQIIDCPRVSPKEIHNCQ